MCKGLRLLGLRCCVMLRAVGICRADVDRCAAHAAALPACQMHGLMNRALCRSLPLFSIHLPTFAPPDISGPAPATEVPWGAKCTQPQLLSWSLWHIAASPLAAHRVHVAVLYRDGSAFLPGGVCTTTRHRMPGSCLILHSGTCAHAGLVRCRSRDDSAAAGGGRHGDRDSQYAPPPPPPWPLCSAPHHGSHFLFFM